MRRSEQSALLQPRNGPRRWRSGRRTAHGGRLPRSHGHTIGGSGNTLRLGAPTAPAVARCSLFCDSASNASNDPQQPLRCTGPIHAWHRLSTEDTPVAVLTLRGQTSAQRAKQRADRRMAHMPVVLQGRRAVSCAAGGGAVGASGRGAHLAPQRLRARALGGAAGGGCRRWHARRNRCCRPRAASRRVGRSRAAGVVPERREYRHDARAACKSQVLPCSARSFPSQADSSHTASAPSARITW